MINIYNADWRGENGTKSCTAAFAQNEWFTSWTFIRKKLLFNIWQFKHLQFYKITCKNN